MIKRRGLRGKLPHKILGYVMFGWGSLNTDIRRGLLKIMQCRIDLGVSGKVGGDTPDAHQQTSCRFP